MTLLLFLMPLLFLACSPGDESVGNASVSASSDASPSQNTDATSSSASGASVSEAAGQTPAPEYCRVRLNIDTDTLADSMRAVVPDLDKTALYYRFGYYRYGESPSNITMYPTLLAASYTDITTKEFELLTGTYVFTLTAYTSSTSVTPILESSTSGEAVTSGTSSLSFAMQESTSSTENAEISVPFSFPARADLSTVTAKLLSLPALSLTASETLTPSDGADGRQTVTFNYSTTKGTYILFLTVTDGQNRSTVIPQMVTAISGATSRPDSAVSTDGVIVISEAQANVRPEVYVSAAGDNDSGNGTSRLPYKTLQKAVEAINTVGLSTEDWTIYVSGTVEGNVKMTSSAIGTLQAKTLTICGRTGSTTDILQGDGTTAVVMVNVPATVTMQSLTITGGSYTMGGGLHVGNESAVVTIGDDVVITGNTNSSESYGGGGAALSNGKLICDGATIKANTAKKMGGGVYIFRGEFELKSGTIGGTNEDKNTITDTNASSGGGVTVGPNGTFTMSGGMIAGHSVYMGGGVSVAGNFTMSGGTIQNNAATTSGGGIVLTSTTATFTMAGGSVTNNSATTTGGGIMNTGILTITNGTITANTALSNGGGIYNSGTVSLSGGTVSGNTASSFGGGIVNTVAGTACIYGTAVIGDSSQLTAATATSCSNTAEEGGGIYSLGRLYFGYSSYTDETTNTPAAFSGGICCNYAGMGGGILVAGGTMIANALPLNYNGSDDGGGGLFVDVGSGTVTINDCAVSGNFSTDDGGGILLMSGNMSILGGTIAANASANNGGAIAMLDDTSLILGGGISIPFGGDVRQNDVYMNKTNCYVQIASALTASLPLATITPEEYTAGRQILTLASGAGTTLAAEYEKFAVTKDSSNPDTPWWIDTEGKLKDKYGDKDSSEGYAVGDIVFNDGSATPYTSGLTLTNSQKAAAIALIFYKGTDLNSDDAEGNTDTTTVRTLGVGLKHNKSLVSWCKSSATACSTNITTIQCPPSGTDRQYTFEGDKNGSDNLEQIAAFLGENNDTGVGENSTKTKEEAAALYPVFYFAKNYKDVSGSNVSGTAYEESWYLPSIAELFQVYVNGRGSSKVFAIDEASQALGGDAFGTSYYWSSSQSNEGDYAAYRLSLDSGVYTGYGCYKSINKSSGSMAVCCIREF